MQTTTQNPVEKMTSYMKDLGLVEGRDFTVSEGHGNRVCVKMNDGHNLGSYKQGLTQVLNDTGYTLELSRAILFVREKKTKK
jgi:hypothetical protein